ncbi:hypothetical protein ACFL4W_03090 [Planctomycetota bacterium]
METAYYDEANAVTYSDQQDLIHRTPWWVVSMIFHGAILLMAAMWVVSEINKEDVVEIIAMNPQTYKKPEYDPTLKREIKRNTTPVEHEVIVDDPFIDKIDIEIDEPETDDDLEFKETKGNKGLTMIDHNSNNADWVYGVGSTGAGRFGDGRGGDKWARVKTGGGSEATEDAVLAALMWFKRHQSADGSWSMGTYHENCTDLPQCESLDLERDYNNWDNCATGFALLCYLGAGNTHKAGPFKRQVADALAYMLEAQADDGSFSSNNYVHAVAAMAMAEAYGMTKSKDLKSPAQKAVNIIISRQNDYLGWTYGNPASRNDTSVTGWQVMALKSAKSSGLGIGNTFEGAAAHFDKVTPEIVGESEPMLSDHVAYTYWTDRDDPGHRNSTCTSIGLLCRVFMGDNVKGRSLRAHANKMLEYLPADYANGKFYEWYYASMAMFQMGGGYWRKWNVAIKEVLLTNQNKGGCEDGSWDPTTDFSCQRGGRLFTTAVGCLTMEVYYRYLPVAMQKR